MNLAFVRSFKPEKHAVTEAEGKSTDAFGVLEHESDENQLDISVTLSAG